MRPNLKYVSIDVETTGLNPRIHLIVEVAAVVADTEDITTPLHELAAYRSVIVRDLSVWSTFCLDLHSKNGLIRDMQLCKDATPDNVYKDLSAFLSSEFGKDPINVAGKNFSGFDRPFLEQLGPFRFRHRVLDPAMLFTTPSDGQLPDLKTCLQRAGLKDVGVEHRALGDALCVIELIRRGYHDYRIRTQETCGERHSNKVLFEHSTRVA